MCGGRGGQEVVVLEARPADRAAQVLRCGERGRSRLDQLAVHQGGGALEHPTGVLRLVDRFAPDETDPGRLPVGAGCGEFGSQCRRRRSLDVQLDRVGVGAEPEPLEDRLTAEIRLQFDERFLGAGNLPIARIRGIDRLHVGPLARAADLEAHREFRLASRDDQLERRTVGRVRRAELLEGVAADAATRRFENRRVEVGLDRHSAALRPLAGPLAAGR